MTAQNTSQDLTIVAGQPSTVTTVLSQDVTVVALSNPVVPTLMSQDVTIVAMKNPIPISLGVVFFVIT